MKTAIEFVDSRYNQVNIEMDDTRNYLSLTGGVAGYYGQCYDHIKPATKAQKRLISFWENYHLKEKYPDDELFTIIADIQDEETKRINKLTKKYTDRYGHIDLYEDERETNLVQTIQTILENEQQTDSVQQEDAQRVLALLRVTESSVADLDGIILIDDARINFWGTNYYVAQRETIEEICRTFLDRGMWVEDVLNGSTDLGFEEWRDEVVGTYDYGILNSYDGSVRTNVINGSIYFVIREF